MEQLSRALKSSLNATIVKLKLTKKQGACFTVEITQVTGLPPSLGMGGQYYMHVLMATHCTLDTRPLTLPFPFSEGVTSESVHVWTLDHSPSVRSVSVVFDSISTCQRVCVCVDTGHADLNVWTQTTPFKGCLFLTHYSVTFTNK
jgi:hypothetical protein